MKTNNNQKRESVPARLKFLLERMQTIISNHTSDDGDYLIFHSIDYEIEYNKLYSEYASLLGG